MKNQLSKARAILEDQNPEPWADLDKIGLQAADWKQLIREYPDVFPGSWTLLSVMESICRARTKS